jgi:hypothetical protein
MKGLVIIYWLKLRGRYPKAPSWRWVEVVVNNER